MKIITYCSLLWLLVLISCSIDSAKYPVLNADGDAVKIALKEVGDGRVHFYSFKNGGNVVDFFVRTDSTGKLHVYFDACHTCFKYKKGYRVEGTNLVCNQCGTRFRLADDVWRHTGCCIPIDVPSVTTREAVIIRVADLQRGEKLF